MDVKDLDSVLLFFYENRTQYQYFDDIKQNFKEKSFTIIELQAIIQKLVKDGYIIEEEQLQTVTSGDTKIIKNNTKVWGWFISYDGIFLINTLPIAFLRQPYIYLTNIEKKKKLAAAIENVPKKYWWIYQPLAFILPFLIGYIIRGANNGQSNLTNQTRTQVAQPIPKIQDTLNKSLPEINGQKSGLDSL